MKDQKLQQNYKQNYIAVEYFVFNACPIFNDVL